MITHPFFIFPENFTHSKEIRFFDDFSIFIWLLACFLADIFSFWNCGFLMQKTASAAQQCIQERSRPQQHTLNSKPLLFLLLNTVHYFNI
jgi:hypothetical protein